MLAACLFVQRVKITNQIKRINCFVHIIMYPYGWSYMPSSYMTYWLNICGWNNSTQFKQRICAVKVWITGEKKQHKRAKSAQMRELLSSSHHHIAARGEEGCEASEGGRRVAALCVLRDMIAVTWSEYFDIYFKTNAFTKNTTARHITDKKSAQQTNPSTPATPATRGLAGCR